MKTKLILILLLIAIIKVQMIYSQHSGTNALKQILDMNSEMRDFAISSNGKYIAITNNDNELNIYSLAKDQLNNYDVKIKINSIQGIDFMPDAQKLLISTTSNEFRLYDIHSKQIVAAWDASNPNGTTQVLTSPSGSFFISLHQGWYDGSLQLFETSSHKLIFEFSPKGGISSAVFTSDGQQIICGGSGIVYIIDSKNGKLLQNSQYLHGGLGIFVNYNNFLNSIYASNRQDDNIDYLDPITGQIISSLYGKETHIQPYLTPDEKYLSYGNTGFVYLLNLSTNQTTEICKISAGCDNRRKRFIVSPDFKYGFDLCDNKISLVNLTDYLFDSKLFTKYFKNYYSEFELAFKTFKPRDEFETINDFFERDKSFIETLVNIKAKYLTLIENEKSGLLTKTIDNTDKINTIINSSVHDTLLTIQELGRYDIDKQTLPIKINNETRIVTIAVEDAKSLKENLNITNVRAKKRLKYDLKNWELFDIIIIHPVSNNEYKFQPK